VKNAPKKENFGERCTRSGGGTVQKKKKAPQMCSEGRGPEPIFLAGEFFHESVAAVKQVTARVVWAGGEKHKKKEKTSNPVCKKMKNTGKGSGGSARPGCFLFRGRKVLFKKNKP